MMDTETALARLQMAIEQSESLRRGLQHRQEDLLSFERDVRDVAAGRTTGRAVIDQAEDIRRAVRYHTADQLAEIRVALTRADTALAGASSDGSTRPGVAGVLGHLINAAGEETRRAVADLEDVDQALSRTSQALPGEPGLADSAQVAIDRAAGRLESARRVTFRILEDLPVIARAFEEMSAGDRPAAHSDPHAEPGVAAQRTLGESRGLRGAVPLGTPRNAGAAPGR